MPRIFGLLGFSGRERGYLHRRRGLGGGHEAVWGAAKMQAWKPIARSKNVKNAVETDGSSTAELGCQGV